MRVYSINTIFISLIVFHWSFVKTNKDGKQDVRTKLCGDPKCTEVLFSSKFIREYNNTSDFAMLLGEVDSNVKVLAIKFSHRPDLFEAKNDNETRGLIYDGFIDLKPYVKFLEEAIKNNSALNIVDIQTGKSIGEVDALSEFNLPIKSEESNDEGDKNEQKLDDKNVEYIQLNFEQKLEEEKQQKQPLSSVIQNVENKEENHNYDILLHSQVPKTETEQQQNDQNVSEEENKEEMSDKFDYCYKDDECKQLDNIRFDTSIHPFGSKLRKMFRELMDTTRFFLPEPLCYFEDTGLIILAFVLISVLLHFTNMLFSKTVGPDPFDYRLLHDCITRLKEQEVIIEQMNANAAENINLREIANNSEKIQRENRILADRIRTADDEISELKQENGELRKNLMNIYHELEQSKNSVEELKITLDSKEADLKSTEAERKRIETELEQTLSQLLQTQNMEAYLDEDLKKALTKLDKLKIEYGLTQQCSKLLQMIEEKEKKVEYSENEREKLRARLSEVELDLRRVEDEKKELLHNYKELEKSLKRSNELNGKLENKIYHEERRLNAKIRQLEEQLITAKSSQIPLNLSAVGGVSSDSDHDFVPLEVSGQSEQSIPSLWSEIEASEPVEESKLSRRNSMQRRKTNFTHLAAVKCFKTQNKKH